IAADGTVLADSQHDASSMENHLTRPEVQAALQQASGVGVSVRTSSTLDRDYAYFAQEVKDASRTSYVYRVAIPLEELNSESRHLLIAIGAAALLTLAFTFIPIYLIFRQFSGTIRQMVAGARRFAESDLQHRIERPGSSELGDLADAFNHMAVQLGRQINQLRAQRNELQAIHQSMNSGLIALDLQQHLLSANRSAEQILQIDGLASRGRLLHEVVREPDLHRFVANAIEQPASLTREFSLARDPDVVIEAVSQPLRDADDKPVGLLVLLNDVSQLRRLEAIRTDFAANVSHELRTPITNIKGYVETMLDVGVDDPEQARQFLRVIQRNTDRLAAIIEDLLALARLEQPDAEKAIEKERVPARQIIDHVLAQFEPSIRERTINIRLETDPDLSVLVNTSLIEQALGNLLSNSIRYSPPSTTITIRARKRDNQWIEFAIRDQGQGIAPEHLERIFERFYRVDKARSREVGGTGLGLSIVKHIARAHDGQVEVDSELGKGSEFRLLLPVS
ncbi:MAG TPA: ATP-binding protein, partial [Phycisphaerales bacterium]|nr:ATP-binding protein [Phycisphaerales bacterium]